MPQEIAATLSRSTVPLIMLRVFIQPRQSASATQALHLQIAEGSPVMRVTSLNLDPEDRPLEYGRTWFAGDRVALTVTPGD